MRAIQLQGYGLGQTSVGYFDSSGNWITTSYPTGSPTSTDTVFPISVGDQGSGGTGSGGGTPPGTPPQQGVPVWLQNIATGLTKAGSQIAIQSSLPAGYALQQTPYGSYVGPAGGASALTSLTGSSSLMPLLLIGGVVMVFMMMAKR